jgi:hypothetical protein
VEVLLPLPVALLLDLVEERIIIQDARGEKVV